ncbi:hypothetical protein quinque_012004 [Culex quinquefasciatus]
MDIRLHNEGCLMATEHNFVAQVRTEDSALLIGVVEFEQARAILINQLRVVKVIRDDLRDERNELRATVAHEDKDPDQAGDASGTADTGTRRTSQEFPTHNVRSRPTKDRN